jgi:hypothetical protein
MINSTRFMFDHEFDLNQVELGEDLPGRASVVGRHRAGDHRLEGDRHRSPRGSQRSDRGPEFGELAAQRLDRRPIVGGPAGLHTVGDPGQLVEHRSQCGVGTRRPHSHVTSPIRGTVGLPED